MEKPTKGRNARSIRITDTLTRALTDWYAQSVVAHRADPLGYVWPGTTGGPMAADTPTQALERALTDAGLLDHDGKPLVSLHGLRHGAGSLLLSQGVPLIVVSRFLGHADVQITAGAYSHLVDADAQLAEAARRMQAALEAADAERPAGAEQLEIPEIAKDTGISR
ncbi:MAG: tyrosine-type recombinase/integrase [Thermoleophilia bacterium]|nr:tyrosine-type recombinase/integrase [Thermoleophilia bacterium]